MSHVSNSSHKRAATSQLLLESHNKLAAGRTGLTGFAPRRDDFAPSPWNKGFVNPTVYAQRSAEVAVTAYDLGLFVMSRGRPNTSRNQTRVKIQKRLGTFNSKGKSKNCSID
eukprot:1695889-Pleurochrysis_carterae.AAC.2